MTLITYIAVFFPLLGFVLAGGLGEFFNARFSGWVTTGLMGVSTVCALILFWAFGLQEQTLKIPLFTWMKVEFLEVEWGLQIDSLSIVMLAVVTIVSFTVHLYSIAYMKGDPGIRRFMAYLSLFTFFMLALVTAPNFLQLFFGWEGVGLCSYLLIGFWYDRDSANAASMKAFIVNRVGDVGFVLGMVTLFVVFGTLDFNDLFGLTQEHHADNFAYLGKEYHALTLACLMLFIGAMGKSAQIGLHTWLPDAMEGPTPVSALIHAATMVTAGVFLIVRISPLLEYTPLAREVITVVGALTALFAATIACVQNDIKRIIAYSTCSQLGYMFMAAGLSGYSAAMFHLTTHAFFKALLFLGAGSVIHAMSDEHNIQKMGGIWRYIPVTYVLMWIGSLALAGMPFFAGFYSKDIIIKIDWVAFLDVGRVAFVCAVAAAVLTGFYAWRLLLLTFHGTPKADETVMSHIHEAPLLMLIPLFVLALGAIFSGTSLEHLFVGMETHFWGDAIFVLPQDEVINKTYSVSLWVEWIGPVAAVLGITVAYVLYLYRTHLAEKLSQVFWPVYNLFYHKWYFDELYQKLFVSSSLKLGKALWEEGDQEIIDGLGPNGLSQLSYAGGGILSRIQTGYIYHYAFAMIFGLIFMIGWYLWG